MKHLRVERPREWEEARLYVLADEHIGDEYHDAEWLNQRIETIKADEHAMVIINGDILNTALKSSVSDIYSEKMNLGTAIEHVTNLLYSIREKIIVGTVGNHEYRAMKEIGFDVMKAVFVNLGIADRYLCEGGIVYIRFGENGRKTHGRERPPKIWYSVYVTHGSGGGRGEAGKANRLVEMSATVDADIYVHSHTHTPMVLRKCFYRADPYNCSVVQIDRLYVNTAASLNYGGYGQRFEFTPSSKRTPVITLNGRKKAAVATL